MTKHGPNCKLKICVCQPVVDQVTKHQTNLRWFAWILRTSPQTTESISFTQTTEQFLLFCLFHHENQLKIPFKPLRWRYARMGTKGLHTRTWKRFFNRKEKRRDFFSIWWHLELRFQRSQTAPIFGVSKTDRLFWRGRRASPLGWRKHLSSWSTMVASTLLEASNHDMFFSHDFWLFWIKKKGFPKCKCKWLEEHIRA